MIVAVQSLRALLPKTATVPKLVLRLVQPQLPTLRLNTYPATPFYFRMASTAPTLPALQWELSAAEIKGVTSSIIEESTKILDAIGAQKGEAVTYESVIAPLMRIDRDMEPRITSITFVKNVSSSKEVREAAGEAQTTLSAFDVKSGMRMDVYEAVKHYAEVVNPSLEGLDEESKRFVTRTIRDYRRKGLHLSEAARKQIEELQTKISDLCIKFSTFLAEDNTKLYFSEADLKGLPEDFIGSLTKTESDGATKYEVTLSYPHVVPILKLCSVPSTRATVEKAFNSRATPQNTEVLETIVQLRRQVAFVLGYPNYAAYVLEERMAESPAKVASFLDELAAGLRPLAVGDLSSLAQLKASEEGPDSGPISMSDYRYYMEQELRTKYSIDHDAIKEYFPLNVVVPNMLEMYQQMLSLKFTQVEGGHVKRWHEDVQLYLVTDAREGQEGKPIGYFYLDLHPREGKYNHAAVFPHIQGCEAGPIPASALVAPERILPVCAMVCNFSKPSAERPSLLRHEEVVTLFHEFGHVAHFLCGKSRLHRFASFRCEQDFVEAPSQMLENWCWQPSTLQLLSGHYKRTGEKLPLELAEKLQISRIAHAGLMNMRQVFLSTFDQELHRLPAAADASSSKEVNTAALLERLHREVLGIPVTPGTNFGASFGHLAGGYEASYYGYLWSEVYAADMFESVFKTAPLDRRTGLRYRDIILASAARKDAKDFLVDFLGRQPSSESFLRSKGIGK